MALTACVGFYFPAFFHGTTNPSASLGKPSRLFGTSRPIRIRGKTEGWWWIRPEACDVTCPENKETVSRRLAVIELTPRDRAREKQLRKRLDEQS